MTIDSFRGPHHFLSNFYYSEVTLDDEPTPYVYLTVEHGYQAAKIKDPASRGVVYTAPSPGAAKRAGRAAELRVDWEEVKIPIMFALLRQKFTDPSLRAMLLATGTEQLIEGNTWGDTFWGVCDGMGDNHLGRLLMQVRDEIKEQPVG